MPRSVTVSYSVWPTGPEVAAGAAALFASSAAAAVGARGRARIAISGGTTPKAMFALLADQSQPYYAQIPWAQLELFWVDERCVPPDHPESNYGAAKQVMLDDVPLKPEQILRMEGELEPEVAASRYEAAIRNAFRLEGAEAPTFDLILLGMGDDGHTASLFPHTDGLNEMGRLVIANHVPQKDTWRITLTWPVIAQARAVAFLIEGNAKAEVLHEVMQGAYDPETYPSQLIRPQSGQLTLLLDAAAASKLPAASGSGTPKTGTVELS